MNVEAQAEHRVGKGCIGFGWKKIYSMLKAQVGKNLACHYPGEEKQRQDYSDVNKNGERLAMECLSIQEKTTTLR